MRKVIFMLILVLGMGATIASATDSGRPIEGTPVPESSVEPLALPDDSSLVFVPVTPCRIIDTRLAGGKIAAGGTRNFWAWGGNLSGQGGSATGCGVNSYASAIAVTFTATQEDGAGNLRAWPYSASMPTASVLNYRAGVDIANSTILPICIFCAAEFTVYANVSGTHLVADVVGYFIKKTPVVLTVEDAPGAFIADSPLCTTGSYTPTLSARAILDGQVSVNSPSTMDYATYLRYSTDGGTNWSYVNDWNSFATVYGGGWATMALSSSLDLTAGTTYIFSVGTHTTVPAGGDSRCHLRVSVVDR